MQSTTRTNSRLSGLGAIAVVLLWCGCHEYVDPWRDDTVGPSVVTTASVEGVRARGAAAPVQVREQERQHNVVTTQDGTVCHFPLGWEDPFEVVGSDDDQFAWTDEDYFAMPYGLGRFIVNTIGVPITVFVHPPVPAQASDGVLHEGDFDEMQDPEEWPSHLSPTPVDILEIGEVMPETEEAPGPSEEA